VGPPDSSPPAIASATLAEDTTSGPIFITPNSSDTTPVTNFKITQIVGGRLYKSDGTTEIVDGDFITKAEGASGLIFKPTADKNSDVGDSFSFKAQAAQDATGTGLSPAMSASITVTQVNDAPVANDDLNVATVDENAGSVTIPYTQLTNNDSKGPSNENTQTLTVDSVTAPVGGTVDTDGTNVIFTPDPNYHGTASFQYKVRDNGTTGSSSNPRTSSNSATVTLTINARADQPIVTDAMTAEDVQSTSGLVITPGSGSGRPATTHFKITGITGGTLYKNDGTTPIADGSFITVAEGGAGLKFTPNAEASGTTGFGFLVQAAPGTDGTKLSDAVPASIRVTEVNDQPVAGDDHLAPIQEDTVSLFIPFADLSQNDSTGAANESGQTLTIRPIDGTAIGGQVAYDETGILFAPDPNFFGTARFQYELTDNGTTNGATDPQTKQATVSFQVDPLADIPNVTSVTTAEDTPTTSGLVITPNDADGTSVTHFLISNIQNGTLFMNDGTTQINNGDFITKAQGEAGLKFLPSADLNSTAGDTFSFDVQAALDGAGKGLSEKQTAQITVTEVNNPPVANDDVLTPIIEDSGDREILFDDLLANDSKGPANESNQHLTVTLNGSVTGGTVTSDGATKFIFTPDPNFHGVASFQYKIEDDGMTNSLADPKAADATITFHVDPVADTPTVTSATTSEDTQTTDGLILSANANDGAEVKYFKISDITGGTLYKNDGTTRINNGDFISRTEGEAGLKFTPDANENSPSGHAFSFNVRAAIEQSDTGLSDPVPANITVSEVNDAPHTVDDHLSSVNENSGEFAVSFEDLLDNDTPGSTNEYGQELTITSVDNEHGGTVRLDAVNQRVFFQPAQNFRGIASFQYTVEDNGTTNGVAKPESATATASFEINARADAPSVTNATTAEDTQTSGGLVITPTTGGGATATHFKISNITGGTLYQNDGHTLIENGDFITAAEGGAGLKFTPDEDAHGTSGFGFTVQAAPGTDGTLLSDPVDAQITVSEVNDAPVAQNDTLPKVAKGTGKVIISYSDLSANDRPGPTDESGQTLTVTDVSPVQGGTVSLVDGHVEFVPDPNFMGTAKFTYTVRDNGRTNGSDDFQTSTAEANFFVVDETQPIITLNGDDTVYLLKGQPYQEPGFSAQDDVDQDLTDRVTVSPSVNPNQLGTYILHYNVTDNSGNAAPEVTRTVHVVSNDLASLSAEGKALTPTFEPGKLAYTLQVPVNQNSIDITADAIDPTATVMIDAEAKGHGGKKSFKLKYGKNSFAIVVTAQGGATKTYTLEITRDNVMKPDTPGHPATETRQAKVVIGAGNEHVVQIDITRSTGSNGSIVDSVLLKGTKVDDVVALATAEKVKIARIVIEDVPGKPSDEVAVSLSADAVGKLNVAGLSVVIEASGSRITLSSETLHQLAANGKDLYVRVVPIRKPDVTQQVQDRVLHAKELLEYAHGATVRAVGQPMTIETNYSDRKTKVMFPLTGFTIPTDPQERRAFLNGLSVFVEHHDGQKDVEIGNVVHDDAGKPVGIEIEVEKFSTFTIISVAGHFKTYQRYISGYPDGTFHPSDNITRAEMASMIARQMELQHPEGANDRYSDVSSSHWASQAVLQLSAAGILAGDVNGTFRPEQPLTRAEMAVIAAKLKKLDLTGAPSTFSDTQGHWAAAMIAAVQKAGLMAGFEDGTFRPEQTLTRAEATAVLNRLFGRPALHNQERSTWPDVSLNDWASPDIESASSDIREFKDGHIEKYKQ
ncbi:MAG: Ig-like domain-containing protein, partial [Tumebacillaceae bacterium]